MSAGRSFALAREAVQRRARTAGVLGGLRDAEAQQRIDLQVGPAVPGWAVRSGLVMVAAALVALSGPLTVPADGTRVLVLTVLLGCLGLGAGAAVWPRSPAAGVLVVVVAIRVLSGTPLPGWRTAALMLGVHVLLGLGAVAAQSAWTARVELDVLRVQARDLLRVQVPAQGLLLVVLALRAALGTGGLLGPAGSDVDRSAGPVLVELVRGASVLGVVAIAAVLLAPRDWFSRRR